MLNYQRIPQYIFDRYVSWKGDSVYGREQWLSSAQKAEEYYYHDVDGTGTTYTALQKANIENTTNIPVSINFLHPIVNQKLAILSQTKPSLKVISTDGRAKAQAQVLDKMKFGIFSKSNTQTEIESMLKDSLVSGAGHIMVTPSDFYQPGMFNLNVLSVPYDEVILDINAKRRSLEDMEGFFIEKALTIPKVMSIYGDILLNLVDDEGKPVDVRSFAGQTWIENNLTDKQDITTTNWNMDNRIIVREYYEKIFTTMYTVPNTQTGLNEYLFAENLDPIQESLLAEAVDKTDNIYIKKTIIMGDFEVWEEILPCTSYPLKTVFFEWGGRPYRSYGMPHFITGMQEASDKILSMMVLNGILSNNAGWTAPKGSIAEEDRKKWEDYGNHPRAIKEYVPKIMDNQVLKPEKDRIDQLGNFYPMVLEMLKNGMEYSSGITPILQGNAKEAGVEVFSSLQQYQNAAMMRITMATSQVNEVMRQLGQVLIEFLVAGIKPDTYQFFDDKGDLNEIKLAQDFVNNMKSYKFLLETVPATAMPTQRLATATELMKIAQSSPDPVERQVLTQKAMELSDVREFDDIMKKLDAVKNSQSKLQALQEAYDRLMETSKQMENKFINISLENKILKEMSSRTADIEGKFSSLETKLKIADQLASQKIKGEQNPQNTNKS